MTHPSNNRGLCDAQCAWNLDGSGLQWQIRIGGCFVQRGEKKVRRRNEGGIARRKGSAKRGGPTEGMATNRSKDCFFYRKHKTQSKHEALASYLKLTPAELLHGSRRGQPIKKNTRSDRDAGLSHVTKPNVISLLHLLFSSCLWLADVCTFLKADRISNVWMCPDPPFICVATGAGQYIPLHILNKASHFLESMESCAH